MNFSKIPFLRWLPVTFAGWLLLTFTLGLSILVALNYTNIYGDLIRLGEGAHFYRYVLADYIFPYLLTFSGLLILCGAAVYGFNFFNRTKEDTPPDALFRQNNAKQIAKIVRDKLYPPSRNPLCARQRARQLLIQFCNFLTSVEVKATPDYSFRIALTGPWGSGKTWVAREASRLLLEDKQQPINIFNVKSSISRNHTQTISQITLHILYKGSPWFLKPFVLLLGIINSIAELSFGAGPLSLKIGTSSLHSATDILRAFARNMPHPLLIIIDDIDRMKPEEIGLFFVAFEEVSHLPQTLFLIVYEPEAVKASIREHQKAWKNTEAFLLKMVDLIIPVTPSNEDKDWEYFKNKAIQLNFPDEALKILEGMKKELPLGNPRIVQRLATYLAQMNPGILPVEDGGSSLYEIMTYEKGLGVIGGDSYLTLARFKLLQMLDYELTERLRVINSTFDKSKKDALEEELLSLANDGHDALTKINLCQNLINSTILGSRNGVERLVANLSQNKPEDLIDLLTPPPKERQDAWENEHFPSLQQSLESFAPLQTAYEVATSQAADTYLAKSNQAYNKRAQELLPLLEVAWRHIQDDPDVEKHFQNFLTTLSRFVHFNANPADKALRNKEEDVLVKIISDRPHLWSIIENQTSSFEATDKAVNERKKRIKVRLNNVLKKSNPDLARKMLSILKNQGVEALLDNQIYLNILRDPLGAFWNKTSPLWNEALDDKLLLELDRLNYRFDHDRKPWIKDPAVAQRLWTLYTSQEWQFRSQYRLGELAANFVFHHPTLAKFVRKPKWIIGDTYDQQYEAILKKLKG